MATNGAIAMAKKNLNRWIGAYLRQEIGRVFGQRKLSNPTHVMFACVDHFEPEWNGANADLQKERVSRWVHEYPVLSFKHQDSDGCHPRHSFFYPAEVYVKENLSLLESLCQKGFGEIDIHLHHDNDSEESLKQILLKAKKDFHAHGFLGKRDLSGHDYFAFIHGNWALNNSRKDGKWCGVNNETHILQETGCYADFTYPSAPSETQPKKINSIYYVKSSSHHPKSHNKGVDVCVGKFSKADLMMIQGPLTLNWKRRTKGVFPRIENGDITGANPPNEDRVDLWVKQRICVKRKPNWIFIKVHTHGAQEKNTDVLLGDKMDQMFSYLESKYNDGEKFFLHYVSAREMYNIIKAAEAGEVGNPGDFRDYLILKNRDYKN